MSVTNYINNRCRYNYSKLKNVVYLVSKYHVKDIHVDGYDAYIEDLDEIPFASRFIKEYLNYKDYFFGASYYPEIQIFIGRGCMAHCNFCVYPQTLHGHQYRLRSPQNVVDEFQYIADNFPDVKEIV